MSIWQKLASFGGWLAPAAKPVQAPPAPPATTPAPVPVQAPPASPQPGKMPLSLPGLASLLGSLGVRDAYDWAVRLYAPMQNAEINTRMRMALFLANVLHESVLFSALRENLNYAADRLVPVFGAHRISAAQAAAFGRTSKQVANQEAIANTVYGGAWGAVNLGNTQPGDGWRFIGRGLMQLTGRSNYERFARVIGTTAEKLAVSLETPEGAVGSAVHFWKASGCNTLADESRVEDCRRKINGGIKGIDEVRRLYSRILAMI